MVSSTPQPHFTPRKEPVPIVQEAGCAQGPVWTGGKFRFHRDSYPDRPALASRYTDLATRPITEMSTRNIFLGVMAAGA